MRLDELKFARQRTAYCYFCATTILPSPELYDGRIGWAKSTILTIAIDDFFDVGASMDEIENLIQCVKKWNIDVDKDCCSEIVRIVFLALKDAVTWIGDRAFKRQSRSITTHLIQTWLDLMKSMLKEAEWTKDNSVPTMSEYTENGIVSFALAPIVFATLYIIEPNLSEEVVQSSEMNNLLRLMSIQGRLLNDIQTYKRELEAGKLNAVTLSTSDGDEEEVVKEIKMIVNDNRKELMRLVLQVNGSIVPRSGKDIFWGMSNMIHLFYAKDDGFSRSDLLKIVKEIIYEPLSM